mmetsp:Transcript_84216/g.180472  ORF Transcript_84216/g.180472 Transcript_84216/m.180472 type:complete len:108 (+) Transcript_84216:951-1274(+)
MNNEPGKEAPRCCGKVRQLHGGRCLSDATGAKENTSPLCSSAGPSASPAKNTEKVAESPTSAYEVFDPRGQVRHLQNTFGIFPTTTWSPCLVRDRDTIQSAECLDIC